MHGLRQSAEFCEKYLKKGTKVVITGRLQTGSYTNRDGAKVYTTDVICEDIEFAESKSQDGSGNQQAAAGGQNAGYEPRQQEMATDADGFMNIPDGIDEELPFS